MTSLALLVLVVVAGTEVNGNKNWLDFGGPFRIQPSELAKLSLVLWGADLLARKERLLGQWKHLLVPMLPVGGLILVLVLLGGDLGTAIIIAAVLGALLWVAGRTAAAVRAWPRCRPLLVITWMVNTRSTRMSRITVWLHPDQADPLGNGLQALHGKFALASGGWWGVGLGGSKEKWGGLPEAHTDFIFAIIGEELGLVGTLAVLGLFGVIGYAGLRVALEATDPFVRSPPPGSPPGSSCRPWSTSARCSGCCPSPACRCRWSPTAARRWCPRCSAWACCCPSPGRAASGGGVALLRRLGRAGRRGRACTSSSPGEGPPATSSLPWPSPTRCAVATRRPRSPRWAPSAAWTPGSSRPAATSWR